MWRCLVNEQHVRCAVNGWTTAAPMCPTHAITALESAAATVPLRPQENITSPLLSAYAGFDPTAQSLHVGHLAVILTLRRFQLHGVRPICLVGGATALVGDPSGRVAERPLLSVNDVEKNTEAITRQLKRFLYFEDSVMDGFEHFRASKSNHALVLDNARWYESMDAVTYMRDVASHYRVKSMLAKDSVRSRWDADSRDDNTGGLSLSEFMYQTLQGYDFLHLARSHDCILQIGGSDQWGNITAGQDIVRRVLKRQVMGMTLPLLTTSTGEKFGKSAGNAVWLCASKTSPYELYQYFLNIHDNDVVQCLRLCSTVPNDRIAELEYCIRDSPHLREAQRELADNVTSLVHGRKASELAKYASTLLFQSDLDRDSLIQLGATALLAALTSAGVSQIEYESANLVQGRKLIDILTESRIVSSKSIARRLVESNGLYVNLRRIDTHDYIVSIADDFVQGKVCLVRTGKKKFHMIVLRNCMLKQESDHASL